MKIFVFSLITNICITEYDVEAEGDIFMQTNFPVNNFLNLISANHEEVMATADANTQMLTEFVTKFVEKIEA
jgi:hypothetical protein